MNWQPEQANLDRVTRADRSKTLQDMHAGFKSLLDNMEPLDLESMIGKADRDLLVLRFS